MKGIYVEVIEKKFGKTYALRNVSFDVPCQGITVLLGPNGSGKTTLMRILMGYINPDCGIAKVGDYDVITQKTQVRKICGYLPENNPLYMDMYVREYLHFVGKIKKTPQLKSRIEEVLNMTGLETHANKKIKELSKGYRQRVGLASAIINDPPFLILDEPTSGLDPIQVIEIRALIKNMGKDKTILLSTHILPEAEKLSDFVIIIHKGQILAKKTIDEILKMTQPKKIMVVEWEKAPHKIPHSPNFNIYQISPVLWEIEYEDEDPYHYLLKFSEELKIPIVSTRYRETSLESFFREIVMSENIEH